MPETVWIFEGIIDIGDGVSFHFACYAEIDENKSDFTIHSKIRDLEAEEDAAEVSSVAVSFVVTNPIEIVTVALIAAKIYGFCVGKKMSIFVFQKVKSYYEESKEKQPKLDLWDRIQDITRNKAANDSDAFVNEAKNALTNCIPFKSFFSGSDDDADISNL